MPYYPSASQQYDEQPALSPHYRQPSYDSDADANYYVDDDSGVAATGHRLPQYQSFGMPTYRGEYKPTQYYYAQGPSYNYLKDRNGANNPLDDLHEKMLQEDERERQSNLPVGQQQQWYQNAGHPKGMTDTFLNNLILYNNKLNAEREREVEAANEYDDDDVYYGEAANPSAYDIYDQQQPFAHAPKIQQLPKIHKPTYFQGQTSNVDRDEYSDYDRPYEHINIPTKEDEDVRELKSLNKIKHIDDNGDNDDFYKAANQPHRFSDTASYNSFDSPAEDYDDDAWINWDRKRSEATQKQSDEMKLNKMKSLQALEQQLRMALKGKQPTETTTTTAKPAKAIPTATPTLDAVLGLMKLKDAKHHEGQKEVVLSRPATPVRHIFSDPVLKAISQVGNKQHSNQVHPLPPIGETRE